MKRQQRPVQTERAFPNDEQYGLPDDDTIVEALRAEQELTRALGRG